MSTWKQFWTLLIFQALSNRKLWRVFAFMLLIYSPFILILALSGKMEVDSNLHAETSNFVALLLGSLTCYSKSKRSLAINLWAGMPTEFLVTRAIDRTILYRSTVALLYLAVLAVPVGVFLFSLKHPDLRVTLYPSDSPASCLSHLPGSSLVTSKAGQQVIFIPEGRWLVAEWQLWAFLATTLVLQTFFLIPFKPLGWSKKLHVLGKIILGILWRLLVLILILPCLILLFAALEVISGVNSFYYFAAHQTAFWIPTVPMLILGQFLCERRFARLEQ